jgi:hypothetical protein
MSLLAKFDQLNNTDLSALSARLAKLRAEMERDLELKAVNPQQTVTATDLNRASQQTGLTPQQLMEALETAKRMGLI